MMGKLVLGLSLDPFRLSILDPDPDPIIRFPSSSVSKFYKKCKSPRYRHSGIVETSQSTKIHRISWRIRILCSRGLIRTSLDGRFQVPNHVFFWNLAKTIKIDNNGQKIAKKKYVHTSRYRVNIKKKISNRPGTTSDEWYRS